MDADKSENILNYERAPSHEPPSRWRWVWWLLMFVVIGYAFMLIDWLETP